MEGQLRSSRTYYLPFTAGTEAAPADPAALCHVYPGEGELAALYQGYLAPSMESFRHTEQAGTEQYGQNHALLPCHSPPLTTKDKRLIHL